MAAKKATKKVPAKKISAKKVSAKKVAKKTATTKTPARKAVSKVVKKPVLKKTNKRPSSPPVVPIKPITDSTGVVMLKSVDEPGLDNSNEGTSVAATLENGVITMNTVE